jgi:DNA-binding MarR family transcriptional regulator
MDLAGLARALGVFATLEPVKFPLHHAQLFIHVALNEPCTYAELEEALNLTNGSVSRSVAALSAFNRFGEPGYRLLTVDKDPSEPRRFQVRLSNKGRALLRTIEAC